MILYDRCSSLVLKKSSLEPLKYVVDHAGLAGGWSFFLLGLGKRRWEKNPTGFAAFSGVSTSKMT